MLGGVGMALMLSYCRDCVDGCHCYSSSLSVEFAASRRSSSQKYRRPIFM